MTSDSDTPLYDRIGGSEAIEAAITAFYERVFEDDRVNHYFDDIDMGRLKRHQQQFFEFGTGGPSEYDVTLIETLHAKHDIDEEAYEVFIGHFAETLDAFGVPEQEHRELMDAINAFRSDVITVE